MLTSWPIRRLAGISSSRCRAADGISDVSGWAKKVLRPELLSFLEEAEDVDATRVLWIVREKHIGHCYGLNRFLALVVAEMISAINKQAKPVGMLLEHRIASIDPTAHACKSPAACYGEGHDAKIERSDGSGNDFSDSFNLIIVRHGQDAKVFMGGAPVPEQHIPYDIPT